MDKFRCIFNRWFTIVFSALLIILLGASFCPARADDTDPLSRLLNQAYAEQQALKTEIEHRRAVLRRSCAGSISLMQELVKLGNQYNMQLGALDKKVAEEVGRHKAFHDEFVSSVDGEGKVQPGRFFEAFLAMQDKAEKAGILAEGPRPQGTPKDMLVLTPQAHKYFFFEEDETKAGQMNETRYELEEAQKKFFEDFNTRREEYYKTYSDSSLEKINGAIQDLYNNIYKTRKKCLEKQEQLRELALTGKYEHCLGFMKTISHKTVVAGNDQEDILQLFTQGSVSTPEGLPGMGFNLTRPMKFSPIQRQEVQDWPYYLYFKSNGTSKLKNIIERRKIQIEAEKEYILTLGRSWRDVCTLGLTKLIPPEKLIEQLPDGPIKELLDRQEKASATFFKSVYGASLQATKTLAAPVEMLKEAANHPVDSVESVAKGVKMFSGFHPDAYGVLTFPSRHPEALNAIDNFNKQIGNMIKEAGSTLADGVLETLDDFEDPSRFDAREGESLFAQAERLTAQLESMQKVKKATELAEKAAGEIVVALTGEAQIRAGAKMLSVGKTAVGSMSEVVRLEAKAANALKRTENLLAEAKAAKVTLPPRITDEIPKLPPAGMDEEVRKIGSKLLEKNQKLQNIIKKTIDGKVPPKFKGDPHTFQLGDEIGSGGFNTFYKDNADANFGIRVSKSQPTREALEAGILDDTYGRHALEKQIKSETIYVPKQEGFEIKEVNGQWVRFERNELVEGVGKTEMMKEAEVSASKTVRDELQNQGQALTQEMEWRLQGKSSEEIKGLRGRELSNKEWGQIFKIDDLVKEKAEAMVKTGEMLTEGQKIALELSIRDINKAGFVWTDFKLDNLKWINQGGDRWKVAVFDTGGIAPVVGKSAENAKAIQEAYWSTSGDQGFMAQVKFQQSLAENLNMNVDTALEEATQLIDWKAMENFSENTFGANRVKRRSEITGLPTTWSGNRPRGSQFKDLGYEDLVKKNAAHEANEIEKILSRDPDHQALKQEIAEGVEKLKDLTKAGEEASEEIVKALEKSDPVDGRPKNRGAASAVLGMPLDEETAGAAKAMTDFSALQLKKVECAQFLEMLHSGVDRATLKKMGNPCEDLRMAQ